jgi:hypothetical protein
VLKYKDRTLKENSFSLFLASRTTYLESSRVFFAEVNMFFDSFYTLRKFIEKVGFRVSVRIRRVTVGVPSRDTFFDRTLEGIFDYLAFRTRLVRLQISPRLSANSSPAAAAGYLWPITRNWLHAETKIHGGSYAAVRALSFDEKCFQRRMKDAQGQLIIRYWEQADFDEFYGDMKVRLDKEFNIA